MTKSREDLNLHGLLYLHHFAFHNRDSHGERQPIGTALHENGITFIELAFPELVAQQNKLPVR